MRSGNEKPAGNTLCIGKGFEAAWAFFCPSKPCVSLSIEGTILNNNCVNYYVAVVKTFNMYNGTYSTRKFFIF